MCNRYETPGERDIQRYWRVGRDHPGRRWDQVLFPRGRGVFIRRDSAADRNGRELVIGQWALIPSFAKTAVLRFTTNNARSEELSQKATFRVPWSRGQRCIIPALSFDEPCWESGSNVWWRFRRADGAPWGLAGLWNTWVDHKTGEIHESYTMLTINADDHPLMRRMHRPKPNTPADAQDKRSVIPLEMSDHEQWLTGSVEEASRLLRLPEPDLFDAGPVSAPPR
ncbi:MAG TPA: SOS response-associated peptidase family protein [Rubrivivax sp.]|nr:SOS response-associated peptidase family protein [Rubrivivax sp.]